MSTNGPIEPAERSALAVIDKRHLSRRVRRNKVWLASCAAIGLLFLVVVVKSVAERADLDSLVAAPFVICLCVAGAVVRANNPVSMGLVALDDGMALRWRCVGASQREGKIVGARVKWTISHGLPPLPERHLVVAVQESGDLRPRTFILANACTRSSVEHLRAAAAAVLRPSG